MDLDVQRGQKMMGEGNNPGQLTAHLSKGKEWQSGCKRQNITGYIIRFGCEHRYTMLLSQDSCCKFCLLLGDSILCNEKVAPL